MPLLWAVCILASAAEARAYDSEAVAKEVVSSDKVKYIDRTGKVIIPPFKAVAFSAFHKGLARIAFYDEGRDLLVGYKDKGNNWIVKPKFWDGPKPIDAPFYGSGFFFGTGNNSHELAVKHFFPPKSDPAFDVMRFGYIDRSGKFAIFPKTEWDSDHEFRIVGKAFDFSEGLALVRLDTYKRDWDQVPFQKYVELEQYAFIDNTGKHVLTLSKGVKAIEPQFNSDSFWISATELRDLEDYERKITGSSFSGGLALVVYEGKYGFIKKNGSWLGATYDNAVPFSEGLAFVREGTEAGFIDTSGKMQIRLPKDLDPYAASFHEGLCRLRPKWKQIGSPLGLPVSFIDKTGKTVFTLDTSKDKVLNLFTGDFSCGLALVRWGDKGFGYVDKLGKWRIPPQYYQAEPFFDGIARVMFDETHSAYIDTTGKVIWKCGVMYGTRCSEGLIGVWSK